MNRRIIDRVIVASVFLGVVVFVKEYFFPNIHVLISLIINALAVLIGYLVGDKIHDHKNKEK